VTPEQLAAWQRGLAQAEADFALQPPDDGTLSASLNRYPERTSFKMCLTCHRDRESEACPHG
jgi:hypothetical protein